MARTLWLALATVAVAAAAAVALAEARSAALSVSLDAESIASASVQRLRTLKRTARDSRRADVQQQAVSETTAAKLYPGVQRLFDPAAARACNPGTGCDMDRARTDYLALLSGRDATEVGAHDRLHAQFDREAAATKRVVRVSFTPVRATSGMHPGTGFVTPFLAALSGSAAPNLATAYNEDEKDAAPAGGCGDDEKVSWNAGHIIAHSLGGDLPFVDVNPLNFFAQDKQSNQRGCWRRSEALAAKLLETHAACVGKLRIRIDFEYPAVPVTDMRYYTPVGGTYTILPDWDCWHAVCSHVNEKKITNALIVLAAAGDTLAFTQRWTNDADVCPTLTEEKGKWNTAAAHRNLCSLVDERRAALPLLHALLTAKRDLTVLSDGVVKAQSLGTVKKALTTACKNADDVMAADPTAAPVVVTALRKTLAAVNGAFTWDARDGLRSTAGLALDAWNKAVREAKALAEAEHKAKAAAQAEADAKAAPTRIRAMDNKGPAPMLGVQRTPPSPSGPVPSGPMPSWVCFGPKCPSTPQTTAQCSGPGCKRTPYDQE